MAEIGLQDSCLDTASAQIAQNIIGHTAQGQRHCTVIRGRRHTKSVADCRHAISRWSHRVGLLLLLQSPLLPTSTNSDIFQVVHFQHSLSCMSFCLLAWGKYAVCVEHFLGAICPASEGFVVHCMCSLVTSWLWRDTNVTSWPVTS